jgi:mono/diheme cytochrome c family protein
MMTSKYMLAAAILIGATLMWLGCEGRPASQPPIHLVPDMDTQPKYKAQRASTFFEDGAAMRPLVPGTVARGELNEDVAYFTGMTSDSKPIKTNPVPITMDLLLRGQERFNIYCAPCHGRAGDGQGIVVKYDYVPPASFHDQRLRDMPDGEIFTTMSNGLRNMPSYKHQVSVADRWAIIAYIRALQRSQNATITDVPADRREDLK